jgi:hypothetical protein
LRNAPAEAGALAKVKLGGTGTARLTPSRHASQASQRLLIAKYRAARGRLNAGLDLIDRSFEIRALLYMGVLDLDDARAAVSVFKYACAAHRWWRRSQ